MVRFILTGIIAMLLVCGAVVPAQTQDAPVPKPAVSQYFAGLVTAISDNSITVSRTILGKESSTRTFVITPETRIDGKPKLKIRVTVQFVAAEDGDHAVHIIVRNPQKKQS